MQTLEDLNAHYKAVRARLNAGPSPKPVELAPPPPAAPEPAPVIFMTVPAFPFTPAQLILQEVADKHGITVKDMKGRCRKNKFSRARQEAAYIIKERLGMSLPKIGRILGNKDHTTILHGIRKHAFRNNLPPLILSKELRAHTDLIEKEISHESSV